MLRMFNLIRNENMKTFKRISTLIMIGLLIVITLAAALIVKFVEKDPDPNIDWKAQLTQQNADLKNNLSQPGMPDSGKRRLERYITINEYRLEHDIPPMKDKSLWGFTFGAKSLIQLISLFVIIIGAGAVANEFSGGTIKLLLIRPAKRWKILLSKYLSTLFWAFVMLIILFVTSFIFGGIFFGFGGISQTYLAFTDGVVRETNIVAELFKQYGISCVDLLMMVTFAFMISVISRNNALAIGISVFLMFTGSMIIQIFSRYDWVKYILFSNTNLNQYIDGVPTVEGMTMAFSLGILAAYFIVFNLVSWLAFVKRDVAA